MAIGERLLADDQTSKAKINIPQSGFDFDWGQSSLIPVLVIIKPHHVQLSAGGETIHFKGNIIHIDADQTLQPRVSLAAREFTVLSSKINVSRPTLVKRVSWFSGKWDNGIEREIQSTSLSDNVLFLRKNGISFFISLDFPYSKIDDSGISYPSNDKIAPGQKLIIHSITIAACRLEGKKVGSFDKVEIEAASEYIEGRYDQRFKRPVFLAGSITNRMADLRENRVFYSMYDNPTVALSPDLVKQDLDLLNELGIEYYQVFEGVFDWPDEERAGKNMVQLQQYAKSLDVKMGDYVSPQGLYCPHFNYYHRALNRQDWLIVDKEGNKGKECLGVREYTDMLAKRLVEHNRKYDLKLICLDFLDIQPCYASDHDHPPADIYQQVKGLVDLMSALNALDDNFLVWSNSGNWIELMPKLVWYNPNVYLTDPHVRGYSPHLNTMKNLDDGRREQMVTVHEKYFVPYTAFTNLEYYAFPGSRLHDTKVFEYGFLQGLAVTPNIGFGELRTFFNNIPFKYVDRYKKFIRWWLDFVKKHYDVWKHTSRLGDAPGVGAAEIYGHIKAGSGFLCLVNQNAFPLNKKIVINRSIGLSKADAFLLSEVYPDRGPIAEQSLPYTLWNDTISFTLAPYSVRIIEIMRKKEMRYPLIYGTEPVSIERDKDGYLVTLNIPQGITKNLGILLQPDEYIADLTVSQKSTVPMYTFSVSTTLVERRGNIARIEVKGPRESAPAALTFWRVNEDPLFREFPSPDRKGFLGGYVHNAFSENYLVQLKIRTAKGGAGPAEGIGPYQVENPSLFIDRVPVTGTVTYTAQFVLPFIERYGLERDASDDVLVELNFSDPKAVTIIGVLLNDAEVPVMIFKNPKNPEYITHYIELKGNVRPGAVELKVVVEYKN